MTFQVRLTAEAVHNQNEIADWIAKRSVEGALSWLDAFDRTLQQLSKSPFSFPLAVEDDFCQKEF
jgi:plasmid stabilization system protein ParE